jgi:YesN/AraC family two-component response regulator
MILEREGHEVMDAPDGKVGIELYRKEPADVVITDIIMPDKEGLETIMDLRREYPEVKVIAISGGGRVKSGDYLHMAAKFGAQLTLTKPFEQEELLEAVRELLG